MTMNLKKIFRFKVKGFKPDYMEYLLCNFNILASILKSPPYWIFEISGRRRSLSFLKVSMEALDKFWLLQNLNLAQRRFVGRHVNQNAKNKFYSWFIIIYTVPPRTLCGNGTTNNNKTQQHKSNKPKKNRLHLEAVLNISSLYTAAATTNKKQQFQGKLAGKVYIIYYLEIKYWKCCFAQNTITGGWVLCEHRKPPRHKGSRKHDERIKLHYNAKENKLRLDQSVCVCSNHKGNFMNWLPAN